MNLGKHRDRGNERAGFRDSVPPTELRRRGEEDPFRLEPSGKGAVLAMSFGGVLQGKAPLDSGMNGMSSDPIWRILTGDSFELEK